MKCLHYCIVGLRSERFKNYRDPEILSIVFRAVSHTNRFVRETGYDVLGTVIDNQGCEGHTFVEGTDEPVPDFVRVAQQLRTGLGDNWSRVICMFCKNT